MSQLNCPNSVLECWEATVKNLFVKRLSKVRNVTR